MLTLNLAKVKLNGWDEAESGDVGEKKRVDFDTLHNTTPTSHR